MPICSAAGAHYEQFCCWTFSIARRSGRSTSTMVSSRHPAFMAPTRATEPKSTCGFTLNISGLQSPEAMETDYKVKLEVFEGPLDLLLFLIKRDEIDIYDISIER